MTRHSVARIFQTYAVLIMIAPLILALTLLSDSFLTGQNLLNILNQNAPLAIMASAMTLVIIAGGFDLSVGAIFAMGAAVSAWVALNFDPFVGLFLAAVVGLALCVVITGLKVHSFLATIATSLIFKGAAVVMSNGRLIPVRMPEFTWLGRGKLGGVFIATWVMVLFALLLSFILTRTSLGRQNLAVGGNQEAAILSGIRANRIRIITFAITGLAAGLAAAIATSRMSMGQASSGTGLKLDAIAAAILGGTSIYDGVGAIWRSVASVLLLALLTNGFNILNADPFYRDLTTGLIILAAIGVSASGKRA